MRFYFVCWLMMLWVTPLCSQQQSAIEDSIRHQAISFGGRIGVAAKDLSSGKTILIDGDSLFPTASIIKLPILVELFYKFNNHELFPQQAISLLDSLKKPGSGVLQFLSDRQTLQLIDIAAMMIILSDNTATNYIIDLFGSDHEGKLDAVNHRMQQLGLQRTKLLNKLYSFATKKKTEEARRFGIGVTSPNDMILLLEGIGRGEIGDSQASTSMIAIMKNQQDLMMAPRYLPFKDDSTLWIANKTGSLDQVKNDVGIVSCSRGTYVYAIFCDKSTDEGEQVDNRATLAVARTSRFLFEYFFRK